MNIRNPKFSGFALALAAAGMVGIASQASAGSAGGNDHAMSSDQANTVHCMGVNSCKGQNDCKTADNACKGQGSCKGQGFLEMSKAKCQKMGGKVMAAGDMDSDDNGNG